MVNKLNGGQGAEIPRETRAFIMLVSDALRDWYASKLIVPERDWSAFAKIACLIYTTLVNTKELTNKATNYSMLEMGPGGVSIGFPA